MSIYTNTPYTYFLMWKFSKMKYYGCQHGKLAHPENILSQKYKTSSKYVHQYWDKFGPPDIIVIHRLFENKHECLLFEHEYLKKVNAVKRNDWLNKTDNKAISTDTYSQESWKRSHESRKHHIETDPVFKQAIAEKCVKNMHSESASIKRLKTFAETGHSKGEKNPRYGVTVKGTSVGKKISEARKAQVELNKELGKLLNAKDYVCEHCGKDNLSVGNYKRWHHANCKSREQVFVPLTVPDSKSHV